MEETIIRARPENVDAAMEIIKELDLKVKQLEEDHKKKPQYLITNQPLPPRKTQSWYFKAQ